LFKKVRLRLTNAVRFAHIGHEDTKARRHEECKPHRRLCRGKRKDARNAKSTLGGRCFGTTEVVVASFTASDGLSAEALAKAEASA